MTAQDPPWPLRKLPVIGPSRGWAMDSTCIPMARGSTNLAAALDGFTRRVLACRVSIALEADSCMDAVEEALVKHGTPEVFDTDEGSRITATDVIKVLAAREIRISMDRKGPWRDTVGVARLWRAIKNEEVFLRAFASVSGARASIGRCLGFDNSRRPHASLDGKSPDQADFNQSAPEAVAACGPPSPRRLAPRVGGVSGHPESAPPSPFHHVRDTPP